LLLLGLLVDMFDEELLLLPNKLRKLLPALLLEL